MYTRTHSTMNSPRANTHARTHGGISGALATAPICVHIRLRRELKDLGRKHRYRHIQRHRRLPNRIKLRESRRRSRRSRDPLTLSISYGERRAAAFLDAVSSRGCATVLRSVHAPQPWAGESRPARMRARARTPASRAPATVRR